MDAIPFDRIDHVAAGVKDLDVAVAWWRDTFGFVREVDFEIAETGARGAFIRRGDVRIELFQPFDPLPMPPGRQAAGTWERRCVKAGSTTSPSRSTTSRARSRSCGAVGSRSPIC